MQENTRKIFEEFLAANLEGSTVDLDPYLERIPESDHRFFLKKVAAYRSVNRTLQSLSHPGAPALHLIASQEEDFLKKKNFAGCRIVRMLGEGGMGVVYLAHQEKLNREVVLKILRPFAADNPNLRQRFLRESKIIAGLVHKNVVPIFDVGEEEGSYFIIMQYLDGIDLGELIDRLEPYSRSEVTLAQVAEFMGGNAEQLPGKNPTEFFLNLMEQIAEAVRFAHEKGVAHRDIKPTNIIVLPDGTPVLLDFGLGWVEKEKEMTLTGEFLGTPVYSAPESFGKKTPTNPFLLDVYSLGVTLYELVTGGLPYSGDSLLEIYANLKNKEPQNPKHFWKHIPKDLETILLKAIAKDPKYRYPSMATLRDDLDNLLHYRPITAQPPGLGQRLFYFTKRNRRLIGSMALLVLALLGILYATRLSVKLEKSEARAVILKQLVELIESRQAKAQEIYEWTDKINTQTAVNVAEISRPSAEMAENIDIVLPWLEKQHQKHPEDLGIMESLSGLYLLIDENQKAKTLAQKILDQDPNNYLAYLVLADVDIVHGDNLPEETEVVQKFNRLFPEEVKLNALLGTKCLAKGDYPCANEFLQLAARQNPKKFLMLLAASRAGAGNFAEAARLHKVALKYYPEDPELYEGLALWLSKMDQFKEARNYAQKALDFDPKDPQRKKLLEAIDAHIKYGLSLAKQTS